MSGVESEAGRDWVTADNGRMDGAGRQALTPDLLRAAQRGAVLVTANERAARTLRRGWDREQRGLGRASWEPLEALSWRSWCHGLWRQMLLEGRASDLLMNAAQEHRVWQGTLAADESAPALRRPEALASMSAEAYRRLRSYRGEERMRGFGPLFQEAALQEDHAAFARWMKSFEQRCERARLLPEAGLEAELTRMLPGSTQGSRRREIVLAGFDTITPSQRELLDAIASAGGVVRVMPAPAPGGGRLVAVEEEDGELRACARWARELLRRAPETRLAVIVSALDRERDEIESVLREVLAPELQGVAEMNTPPPYEFSLGRPLATEPMVQAALNLLAWATAPLPVDEVTRLLLSPYFAGGRESGTERSARAELDAAVRREEVLLRPEMTIAELHAAMERRPRLAARLPLLRLALREMEGGSGRFVGRRRSFGEWAEIFRGWLSAARWNGVPGGLNSLAFQVRERWEGVLDTLATLDFLGESVELNEARTTLQRLCRETIFAAEGREAAVQVMGPLEAAGSEFDALWVLRAGELSWPPRAGSQPLLPRRLQRELGMPGADAERDRVAARQMTRRLAASATEVIFSYAKVTADRAHQVEAAAVRELGLVPAELTALAPLDPEAVPIELERVEEHSVIAELPDAVHRGGVRVLELQAACGFRAFAEMRLGSSEPKARTLGLNAGERGSTVHDALEFFWKEVRSQEALRGMTAAARGDMLEDAVGTGLRTAVERSQTPWDAAYVEAQRKRLWRLLNEWLELELKRPAFTVMQQEEQRKDVRVGPLRLSLRVDRTDLVNGTRVVIDYKTGPANPRAWLGERPDSPQLPLYAVLANAAAGLASGGGGEEGDEGSSAPLGAVAFAEVRTGSGLRLRGLEEVPGTTLPQRGKATRQTMDAETFAGQVELWQNVVERLASEFAAGDARIRPKQYPTTCDRCGQRLLCRVDASLLAIEDAAEEELPGEHSGEAGELG